MKLSRLLPLLALTASLAACGTIRNLNPFGRGGDAGETTAAEGKRISVIALDQTITPAEALKGATFTLPPPVAVAEWPLPGGTPEQSVEHAEAAPAFEIAWRRDFGQGSSRRNQVTAPPVAAGGRIFVMDGEATVSALDASNGGQVWRVNLTPTDRRDRVAYGGGVAHADGRVYVSSGFRFIAALDAATGAVVWRTPTEAPVRGAPTVAAGRVFAISTENEIIALETATGAQAWTYQGLVEPARFAISSSPAVSGDVVVAPFSSGELAALRLQNGSELWTDVLSRASRTTALSEIRDIAGRPVIYRGDVYAASHSGVFSATDLRTGQRRWSVPLASLTTPAPAGDVVFAVSKAGELIAAARDSGQIYWLTELNRGRTRKQGGVFGFFDREVRPVWSGPLLASNRLILVSTEGDAVTVDPMTGQVTKTIRLGSPAFLTPIAANGMVYVVTDEAELIAIR
ncbi:MAG TPA: PQQ-binding-like beta-propeller repeat protein [Caulobacteraceae bacterium]|jgi:outer membrane protein assembly factor BamB